MYDFIAQFLRISGDFHDVNFVEGENLVLALVILPIREAQPKGADRRCAFCNLD